MGRICSSLSSKRRLEMNKIKKTDPNQPSFPSEKNQKSGKAEQIPFSGAKFFELLRKFLNLFPDKPLDFFPKLTGKIFFSNKQVRTKLVSTLTNQFIKKATESFILNKEKKETTEKTFKIVQKKFEAIYKTLDEDQLEALSALIKEKPHTAYFLYNNEIYNKDTPLLIKKIFENPKAIELALDIPDHLKEKTKDLKEIFNFAIKVFNIIIEDNDVAKQENLISILEKDREKTKQLMEHLFEYVKEADKIPTIDDLIDLSKYV
jgi:hypothetical protein